MNPITITGFSGTVIYSGPRNYCPRRFLKMPTHWGLSSDPSAVARTDTISSPNRGITGAF